MTMRRFADAREERADHERAHLVPGGVDAHRLGGDLVLADGEEGAAVRGVAQALGNEDGGDGRSPDPGEVGAMGNWREPDGAAEEGSVLDDHPDDLAEAERDDGE